MVVVDSDNDVVDSDMMMLIVSRQHIMDIYTL